jgi:hypothetical protein
MNKKSLKSRLKLISVNFSRKASVNPQISGKNLKDLKGKIHFQDDYDYKSMRILTK